MENDKELKQAKKRMEKICFFLVYSTFSGAGIPDNKGRGFPGNRHREVTSVFGLAAGQLF